MKTILLTGAPGFLGSHLLKRLLKDNYNVIILKRSFSNTFRIADLLTDIKQYNIDLINLEDVFKENKIDTVIHCATNYGRNNESHLNILQSNLILPLTILHYNGPVLCKVILESDYIFLPKLSSKKLEDGTMISPRLS